MKLLLQFTRGLSKDILPRSHFTVGVTLKHNEKKKTIFPVKENARTTQARTSVNMETNADFQAHKDETVDGTSEFK